jgi:exocyst complex component 2
MTVVTELDKTLFEGYIKAKSDAVTSIIRGGILDDQMDWYETPQPKGMSSESDALIISTASNAEIRPYMYETLIAIVSVHAQVCSIVEQLLDRTLNAIVEEVATEALRCFRQVKRFGMGGMLRVCSFPFSSVIAIF